MVHLWVMSRTGFSAQDSTSDTDGIIHRHSAVNFFPPGQMGFCFVSAPSSLTPQRPTPAPIHPSPRSLGSHKRWIDRGCCFPVTRWREPLPTLLILHKEESASVLLSHSGSRPYLLLQQSLAHPNTQHSFCPSKWCAPWVPPSSLLVFTLFLDTLKYPHILLHPCAESTHTKCMLLLLRFRHLQPTTWSVPFGYRLGNTANVCKSIHILLSGPFLCSVLVY